MNDLVYFLITLYYQRPNGSGTTLQVALQTKQWLGYDSTYLEENRNHLQSLLPLHIKNAGPIVKVERLFDMVVIP